MKVPIFGGCPVENPTKKANRLEALLRGISLSEYGSERFRVRLRRLSEYGSVASLVERPTRETRAKQYSDTVLIKPQSCSAIVASAPFSSSDVASSAHAAVVASFLLQIFCFNIAGSSDMFVDSSSLGTLGRRGFAEPGASDVGMRACVCDVCMRAYVTCACVRACMCVW